MTSGTAMIMGYGDDGWAIFAPPPGVRHLGLSVQHRLPHRPHIAARAEAARPPALEQHQADLVIVGPLFQRPGDAVDHFEAERVDRLRAVERNDPEMAFADHIELAGHTCVPMFPSE
jgi:hypothetical protein